MAKYEVWGIGYDKDGYLTDYLTQYKDSDTPGDALTFAHNIDADWLKENGKLPANVAAVDVIVELHEDDGTMPNETPFWSGKVDIYHKMNFGLQPNTNAA